MAMPWAGIAEDGMNLVEGFANSNWDRGTRTSSNSRQTPQYMDRNMWLNALGLTSSGVNMRNQMATQFPGMLQSMADRLTEGGKHDPNVYSMAAMRSMASRAYQGSRVSLANSAAGSGAGMSRVLGGAMRMDARRSNEGTLIDTWNTGRDMGTSYYDQLRSMVMNSQMYEPLRGSVSSSSSASHTKQRTDWSQMGEMFAPGLGMM